MEQIRATITSVGHYLPEDRLTNFDLEKPYKSVPSLASLYRDISKLDDNYWKAIKLKEVSGLIQSCLALRLQFNIFKETGVVKTSLPTQLLILNLLLG